MLAVGVRALCVCLIFFEYGANVEFVLAGAEPCSKALSSTAQRIFALANMPTPICRLTNRGYYLSYMSFFLGSIVLRLMKVELSFTNS
jgi:hypothetical protein